MRKGKVMDLGANGPLGMMISLCDRTGNMARPWAEAGYVCYAVDIQHSIRKTTAGKPEVEQVGAGAIVYEWGDIRSWVPPRHMRHLPIAFVSIFSPCFVGDTLVLTQDGYKPIKSVLIGEKVLTHMGRWKRVTDVQSRYAAKTLGVMVSGSPEIITTDEHPFYVRRRTWSTKREVGKNIRECIDSQPMWQAAGGLTNSYKVGSCLPPTVESNIPNATLWLMGRYVADGHLRYYKGEPREACLSIGKTKADDVRPRIPFTFRESEERTSTRFYISDKKFVSQLSQFGRHAEEKSLPGWVLSLPQPQAQIFLDGYLSGDGYVVGDKVSASTVSPRLAASVAILMRRAMGVPVSYNRGSRKPTTVIEGRTVSQRDSLVVYCTTGPDKSKRRAIIDGDRTWYQFRKSRELPGAMVYNLSVEDDESYMVNQCIVHNCTHLTVAGARDFQTKGIPMLTDGLMLFSAGIQVAEWSGAPYMAENPVGVISSHFRKPDHAFNPNEYAGYLDDPSTDAYTKKTCLWTGNGFVMPPKKAVPPAKGSMMHRLPPSDDRADLRSATPMGFAKAVFLANAPHLKNTLAKAG